MNVKMIFSEEQKRVIVSAIESAEKSSSAEIRVHIESKCSGDVMERAAIIFSKLKMERTELRNGVLIYIAVDDKKVAILGDKGINEKVEDGFWDSVYKVMVDKFKNQDLTGGLCLACDMVGEKLKRFFPISKSDINELSNEISFEEK